MGCPATGLPAAAMNKASIDSLLNPLTDSPFPLRAAYSWEPTTAKHPDHPPWPRSLYSDERTGTSLSRRAPQPPLTPAPPALPGDPRPPAAAPRDRDPYPYPDSFRSPPPESTAWQTTERASVRLAARGTAPHNSLGPSTSHSQHDARYCATGPSASSAMHSAGPPCPQNRPQYYFQSPYSLPLNHSPPHPETHPLDHSSFHHSQEPPSSSQPLPDTVSDPEASHSSTRKRSQPDSEGLAEPQSKRVKEKVKSAAEAATTSTGTKSSCLPYSTRRSLPHLPHSPCPGPAKRSNKRTKAAQQQGTYLCISLLPLPVVATR
jgi:lysine-specific demethylase 3